MSKSSYGEQIGEVKNSHFWKTKTAVPHAAGLWAMTYGEGMSDREAFDRIGNDLIDHNAPIRGRAAAALGRTGPLSDDLDDDMKFINDMFFCARWANEGFGHLCTSQKFAAALMSTDAPRDMLASVHLPWRSFVVDVPDGILVYDNIDYRRIHVSVDLDGISGPHNEIVLCGFGIGGIRRIRNSTPDLATLLSLGDAVEDRIAGDRLDGHERRIFQLAGRFVLGLLLAFDESPAATRIVSAHSGKTRRDGPPKHRIAFVSKAIKTDCRLAVRDFLSGARRGLPSVQSLVRGHHKRQVIGVTRAGRKVIWIEPYWRGPEDAPILVRPYKIGAGA